MKWSNLVSLTLLSYLTSMSVYAQPAGLPADQANVPQQAAAPNSTPTSDSMSIEDSGGNLKIMPKGQQPAAAPQAPPDQMMSNPPQGTPVQPPSDSVEMNPSPPQGELQAPSNTNQSMVPAGPEQDSMPEPNQGSMQN